MSVAAGLAATSPGAGHCCLPYHDRASLPGIARRFLGEALERGERAIYARAGASGSERRVVDGLGEGRPGALQIVDVNELPGPDPGRDPAHWPDGLAEMTRAALAEGFSGLRLFADVTGRVVDETGRAVYVRYEHVLGSLTRREPLGLLCAYDVGRLGRSAAAELAAVHDAGGEELVSFQLTPAVDADLALSGAIDAFSVAPFARALDLVGPSEERGIAIDASGLEFICHQALIALADYARRRGTPITLRACPGVVERMVAVLELDVIRIEDAER